MPRISIITPLHNKGPFVAETLASVQAQTFADWEMIVVENHSSDNGPAQVEHAASQDDRILLLRASDSVRGPCAARNLGLCEARGEWVLFLDADDLLDPAYLERMLGKQTAAPEAVVVAAPWVEFSDGSKPRQGVVKLPAARTTNGKRIEDSAIAHTCWAVHAAMVRRSWLSKREWPEELDGYLAEDTAFWFRVVFGAKIVYSDFPGAFYRTQTENCRTNYSAKAWYEGNHRAVLLNLEFMKSKGRSLSMAQMETLVRHYEILYDKAIREGERQVADSALVCARRWLEKFSSMDGPRSVTMSLRQFLGIPRFRYLKIFSVVILKNRPA
ncbi:glycosyltransferase family 2 protein [Synechococcus sp. BSF8S]|uniref:glycosyltransferase family 2 protein n=1 Tax=Synechococcales TaxID=1890424 RepID=UPI0016235893|nr:MULTISPECIES: glycosyltransferase family 2 protein [unclassified Synechococcus]MBC1262421.1 glycosyltransferase family 2 protein [Synechococcus sp. BSF8S]MBC1265323.1 glycosyltransferase family 2 protein [Synechococcus sp. BSA11S]